MQVGLVAVAMVSLVGCYQGVDVEDLVDEIAEMRDTENNAIKLNGFTFNGISFNGFGFNGISFNGVSFNGFSFNGVSFNGISFNGVSFNGVSFNDVSLNGSSIEVKKKVNGKWLRKGGEELVGMDMKITADVRDSEGGQHVMDFLVRADDIYTDLVYDDIHYYHLSISLKGTDVWQPLCEGGVPAIPLQNYWNEATGARVDDKNFVTFACTNGVLAHCTQWGYRPWAEAEQCDDGKGKKGKKHCHDISLQDHHQACTRMARADYCGDGVAWTVPGTPIDIYDALDPQIEAPETDWPVEAEWKPNGAYCLNDIRQQGWKAQGKYPTCKGSKAKVVANCGTLKDDRALVASKFEPLKK
ncbi:ADYC domain-containing protein [Nannocystis sp.]|uniref:ADYC domain-containing protein n=1 Tax=Nannocystis sp. TaxID=1962667 RepID=UPI0025FA8382|nr:ADYC domain-containing protein [Nannocystis sp.]